MKTPSTQHTRAMSGFTLMEVLVVISIIAVLATMTVGGMNWYKRKAAIGKTQVLIKSIENALEEYKGDHNGYPKGDGMDDSTEELYMALYGDGVGNDGIAGTPDDTEPDGQLDPGATTYLATLDPSLTRSKSNVKEEGDSYVIIDAWKKPLFYRHGEPDQMNPDFDIWSHGPDGKGEPDGEDKEKRDDITNWK